MTKFLKLLILSNFGIFLYFCDAKMSCSHVVALVSEAIHNFTTTIRGNNGSYISAQLTNRTLLIHAHLFDSKKIELDPEFNSAGALKNLLLHYAGHYESVRFEGDTETGELTYACSDVKNIMYQNNFEFVSFEKQGTLSVILFKVSSVSSKKIFPLPSNFGAALGDFHTFNNEISAMYFLRWAITTDFSTFPLQNHPFTPNGIHELFSAIKMIRLQGRLLLLRELHAEQNTPSDFKNIMSLALEDFVEWHKFIQEAPNNTWTPELFVALIQNIDPLTLNVIRSMILDAPELEPTLEETNPNKLTVQTIRKLLLQQ